MAVELRGCPKVCGVVMKWLLLRYILVVLQALLGNIKL